MSLQTELSCLMGFYIIITGWIVYTRKLSLHALGLELHKDGIMIQIPVSIIDNGINQEMFLIIFIETLLLTITTQASDKVSFLIGLSVFIINVFFVVWKLVL